MKREREFNWRLAYKTVSKHCTFNKVWSWSTTKMWSGDKPLATNTSQQSHWTSWRCCKASGLQNVVTTSLPCLVRMEQLLSSGAQTVWKKFRMRGRKETRQATQGMLGNSKVCLNQPELLVISHRTPLDPPRCLFMLNRILFDFSLNSQSSLSSVNHFKLMLHFPQVSKRSFLGRAEAERVEVCTKMCTVDEVLHCVVIYMI